VIDNLSTGRIENLDPVRESADLTVRLDTIANEPLLMEMVDRADVIYHLAAAVGVRLIVEDPVHSIETNIYGTELLLRHAARKGKKVFLASTSEVYGKGVKHEFSEEDDLLFGATTKSRWSYGCSKAIDEFLSLAYHQSRGLPVIVGRFFNTVGPRQVGHYGMVVPRFVGQALSGGPITVYGEGDQVRCFTHVLDVVDAVIRLCETSEAEGRIFNIGSERPITILALAERVRERVNPKAEIQFVPYEEAYGPGFEDIHSRIPDVSRLRGLIGWEASRSLEQILDDVRVDLEGRGGGGRP
jgi:UDP-glucose 4-epimerase